MTSSKIYVSYLIDVVFLLLFSTAFPPPPSSEDDLEPNNTIMIRGLAQHLAENDIRKDIQECGLTARDIRLIRKKETGTVCPPSPLLPYSYTLARKVRSGPLFFRMGGCTYLCVSACVCISNGPLLPSSWERGGPAEGGLVCKAILFMFLQLSEATTFLDPAG